MANAAVQPDPRLRPMRRAVFWVGLPFLLVLTVCSGALIYLSHEHREKKTDVNDARRVAGRVVTNFYTLDYRTFDSDIQRVLADLYGKAKDSEVKQSAKQKQLYTKQKLVTHGTLWAAGLVTIGDTTAEVAVTANVTKDAQAADTEKKPGKGKASATIPSAGYVRAQVSLVKRNDRWLVSQLKLVP